MIQGSKTLHFGCTHRPFRAALLRREGKASGRSFTKSSGNYFAKSSFNSFPEVPCQSQHASEMLGSKNFVPAQSKTGENHPTSHLHQNINRAKLMKQLSSNSSITTRFEDVSFRLIFIFLVSLRQIVWRNEACACFKPKLDPDVSYQAATQWEAKISSPKSLPPFRGALPPDWEGEEASFTSCQKHLSAALCASLKSTNSQGGKMCKCIDQVLKKNQLHPFVSLPKPTCLSDETCGVDLVPARECNQNRLPSTRTSEKLQFQTKRLQMKLNAACSSSSLSESGKSSEHTKPVPVHAPCFCRVGKCVFSQNMLWVIGWLPWNYIPQPGQSVRSLSGPQRECTHNPLSFSFATLCTICLYYLSNEAYIDTIFKNGDQIALIYLHTCSNMFINAVCIFAIM